MHSKTRASIRLHNLSLSVIARRRLNLAYALHRPPRTAQTEHAPLVFLHGLFGSKQNNRSISKALARDLERPVYALDLRNHGDSPHDPAHNYLTMADDVEEFMWNQSLVKPTLIGHSMGAKAAMTLALRSPDAVGALISVDNAPVDASLTSDFVKYLQGMRDIDNGHVRKQADADDMLKKYVEASPIRQFLLTNLVRSPKSQYLRLRIPLKTLAVSLDYMGDFPFKNPDEARYDRPTLFVRGTKSHYVADEALPLIGQFFPRFELKDIDSGHWVISEKPEAFREAVVEFVKRNDSIVNQ